MIIASMVIQFLVTFAAFYAFERVFRLKKVILECAKEIDSLHERLKVLEKEP